MPIVWEVFKNRTKKSSQCKKNLTLAQEAAITEKSLEPQQMLNFLCLAAAIKVLFSGELSQDLIEQGSSLLYQYLVNFHEVRAKLLHGFFESRYTRSMGLKQSNLITTGWFIFQTNYWTMDLYIISGHSQQKD